VDRILLAALLGASAGCIDWDSLYEQRDAAAEDDVDAAARVDAPLSPLGCSDGTAEQLFETGLAACDGAWSVPGVVNDQGPTCDRRAGNSADNTSGEGCSVADLCGVGWHVCRDAADVAAHGGETACAELRPPDPDGGDSYIYLTRQSGGDPDAGGCKPDGSTEGTADDVWGCGTLGVETLDCAPLDRHLALGVDNGGCVDPYNCGEDPTAEGLNITKIGEPSRGGGVLCCSDSAP
jgi:hypothetical protein